MRHFVFGSRTVMIGALAFSACGGAAGDESRPLVEGAQRLVDPALVLGFEGTQHWSTSSGTKSVSSDHTQGSNALALRNFTYAELQSVQLSTLAGITSTISLDLKPPVSPAWGEAHLYIDIPSQGVYYHHVGEVSLAGIPANTYRTLSWSLPSELVSALQQTYSDLTFGIVLDVPTTTTQDYLLDNLRFGGPPPADNIVKLRVSGSPTQTGTVDDFVVVSVDGVRRKTFYLGDPSVNQQIDVTSWFASGNNEVRVHAINTGGPTSFNVELWVDDQLVVNQACASTLCNGSDAGVGILLDQTYEVNTPGRPARQPVQVTSATAGKLYIGDTFTGLTTTGTSTPTSLSLPPGSYTLGLGVSTETPPTYTGAYHEASVTVASAPVAVNLTASPALPVQETTRIAILPIRQSDNFPTGTGNIGVLKNSDVTQLVAQAQASRDQWLKPFSYGLATWEITVLPAVEDTAIVETAPGQIDTTAFIQQEPDAQAAIQNYDMVVFFFSQHKADDTPVADPLGIAWAFGRQNVGFTTNFTRGGGTGANPFFLHEVLHNYEAYNSDVLHFYNGVDGLHGATEHGYTFGSGGEPDFVRFYRAFMRGQSADLDGMRQNVDWPTIPATADLYTGVFPTLRRGFSPP